MRWLLLSFFFSSYFSLFFNASHFCFILLGFGSVALRLYSVLLFQCGRLSFCPFEIVEHVQQIKPFLFSLWRLYTFVRFICGQQFWTTFIIGLGHVNTLCAASSHVCMPQSNKRNYNFFFFSLLSFAQFILCKISVALFFYLIFFKQATFLLLRKKKKKRKTITIHAPHSNAIFISKKK